MSGQLWWHMARASGIVAWALIMASLVWGVLLATRILRPVDRPAWLLALHRWFAGLAVVATALHVATLVTDNYVHFGPAEVLVPFAASWRSGAVALGVAAMYALVAVQVTSLLMKRLPRRWWRAVHLASYALAWLVTVHAGAAGSDVRNRVYQAFALLLTIAGVTAAVIRVTTSRRRPATGASAAAPPI